MTAATILIADDDPVICDVLQQIVSELGHEATCTYTAKDTIEAAEGKSYDLVLLDLRFPDCKDLSTLAKIREKRPSTDVIIVTAEAENLGIVTEAVRLGAFDYVPKPIREDDIRIRVTRVLEMRSLTRSHDYAITELAKGRQFKDIIGQSAAIQSVVRQAQELAGYDLPVLITGETGTGKELTARALHYGGPRRSKPFISVNCAALPDELVQSELFGHEKGAFTGAHIERKGAFEDAADGTIFLDEIGDMNLQAQASLLRILDTGEYRSVGGKAKELSAWVVLATNQDLDTLIRDNRFRKDLFYRIDRVRIDIPSLRKRKEDIPILAQHFLDSMNNKIGKGVCRIDSDVLECFCRYDWPGNVRELKNVIERAYIHASEDVITVVNLSPELVAARLPHEGNSPMDPKSLEEIHRLIDALRTSGGNVSKTAELLGVHRNTVHRWLKRYSLENHTP